jgi:hypothetical protein
MEESTSGRRATNCEKLGSATASGREEWGLAVAKLERPNKARPRPRQSSERARILPSTCLALPSFPSLFPSPFPFPFIPSSSLSSSFPHHLPSPTSPPLYAPLVLPRSGSTSPSSSNRTAGQCATHSDHVQPTCPTRPCSSSNQQHPGAEGAVHRTRNSGFYHHPHRRAIRERPELFVPPTSFVINPSRFSHSLRSFVHPRQGLWGWLLWYGLALRLAWGATPQ